MGYAGGPGHCPFSRSMHPKRLDVPLRQQAWPSPHVLHPSHVLRLQFVFGSHAVRHPAKQQKLVGPYASMQSMQLMPQRLGSVA